MSHGKSGSRHLTFLFVLHVSCNFRFGRYWGGLGARFCSTSNGKPGSGNLWLCPDRVFAPRLMQNRGPGTLCFLRTAFLLWIFFALAESVVVGGVGEDSERVCVPRLMENGVSEILRFVPDRVFASRLVETRVADTLRFLPEGVFATHSHISCFMWLKLDLCVCAARDLAEGARFRGGPWQRVYTLISFG